MNNKLHSALQSAQWGCGAILDAEFFRTHMPASNHLDPIKSAQKHLMDALDKLSSYRAELVEGEKAGAP